MRTDNEPGYALAVDVGGTFVDLTLCDLTTGRRWVRKVLSNLGPHQAFIDGLQAVCADAGIAVGQISRVVHGMTLATNAILELRNDRAAVVVTEGFRDALEIGRHDAPRGTRHGWLKQRRPIGRDRIVEAPERLAWNGEVLMPLTDDGIREVVDQLRDLQPTSVAISLLHGHRFPEHESLLAETITSALPGVHVCVSHEVLPQSGEYERLMATALNAYTMPAVTDYLRNLEAELERSGVRAPLYVMSSDGGVISSRDAQRFPINTVLSGPAGGAAGAAGFAAGLGKPFIFSLDVGGTSSDVASTEGGQVDMTVTGQVGAFPIARPILDMHTVGAGGGSLARVRDGRFTVGPASAGSSPGPACYGKGGDQPTVTDALLVLGLPEKLAGGALTLSLEAARSAIEEGVAQPLGLDVTQAAAGIVRLANAHMAAAIRHVSTERGRDPRDYALIPFGGAGGLHAVDVAAQVGIPEVIVPPAPGVFTTEGLLAADLSRHYVYSFDVPEKLGAMKPAALAALFGELEAGAQEWLDGGASTLSQRKERLLDLRYVNQGYELIIPLAGDQLDEAAIADAIAQYHSSYETRYRYRLPDVPVEVVRVRVAASGALPHANRGPLAAGEPRSRGETRAVHFDDGGWQDTPVIDRATLRPAECVTGPAIVEEYDSTTVLPPGATARVDGSGALVITYEQTAGNGGI